MLQSLPFAPFLLLRARGDYARVCHSRASNGETTQFWKRMLIGLIIRLTKLAMYPNPSTFNSSTILAAIPSVLTTLFINTGHVFQLQYLQSRTGEQLPDFLQVEEKAPRPIGWRIAFLVVRRIEPSYVEVAAELCANHRV
mmetsp:Transcript_19997/g.36461  ORF Transcript_19997/g.36461 Transcript_19997/m.36461 type:complete len:140 (-) Transcript_19997:1215-1634(-)